MKTAFFSPAAYPLFDPLSPGGIGGAEVRAYLFATGLAGNSSYDVRFVVGSDWLSRPKRFGAITVQPTPQRRISFVRFASRLARSTRKRISKQPQRNLFFEKLDADVLCCFGVRDDTAEIVRSARLSGKRVLVFLTSDRTLSDVRRQGTQDRGAYGEQGHLCRYSLANSDAVVVQTQSQLDGLRSILGIEPFLIRNPIATQPSAYGPPTRDVRLPAQFMLWVGRADCFSKRADLCWQLAALCAPIPLVAIMNNCDSVTYDRLVRSTPSNVVVIEKVPYAHIDGYYRLATALINTSDVEGFPNSFLQAGKSGVPVVSLNVDPDGMLTRHGCGIACNGDLVAMARTAKGLFEDQARIKRIGNRIRQYVTRNHALSGRVEELDQLIRQVTTVKKSA